MRFPTRALALSLLAIVLFVPPAAASPGYVGILTVNGPITSVRARYLARSIDDAAADRARLVVIKLDTPGGLLSSTRRMVESILGSKMGTIRVAEDVPALIEHHRAGRLDLQGMVSSTHALDDIAKAFEEVWRGDVLRTVVLPNVTASQEQEAPVPC